MDETTEIGPLTRPMLETAAATLGRAFYEDPMFEWVFPDPAPRLKRLTVLGRVPLGYGLRYDLTVRQTEGGRCVAIWVPPGQSLTPLRMARCGLLAAPFRAGFGPLARFAGANATMEPVHEQAMGGLPHWQLLILTVDPERQGRGHGTALLREGLDRVDRDGLACYLDTSTPSNVPFYERLGFEVVGEVPLGKGGPPGWGMRRGPVSVRP